MLKVESAHLDELNIIHDGALISRAMLRAFVAKVENSWSRTIQDASRSNRRLAGGRSGITLGPLEFSGYRCDDNMYDPDFPYTVGRTLTRSTNGSLF